MEEQLTEVFVPDQLPVLFEIAGAEIRSAESEDMKVTFYRLPAGADGRPLLQGLPGGSCHCPHWGYVISGRLRIHAADGDQPAAPAQHDPGRGKPPRRRHGPRLHPDPPVDRVPPGDDQLDLIKRHSAE